MVMFGSNWGVFVHTRALNIIWITFESLTQTRTHRSDPELHEIESLKISWAKIHTLEYFPRIFSSKGKITTEKDWKWFAMRGTERERSLILTYILFQFIFIACHLETRDWKRTKRSVKRLSVLIFPSHFVETDAWIFEVSRKVLVQIFSMKFFKNNWICFTLSLSMPLW